MTKVYKFKTKSPKNITKSYLTMSKLIPKSCACLKFSTLLHKLKRCVARKPSAKTFNRTTAGGYSHEQTSHVDRLKAEPPPRVPRDLVRGDVQLDGKKHCERPIPHSPKQG